jgi:microcystin-dependent protein
MAYFGDGSNLSSVPGVPSGAIILWSGASNAIPSGYVLCDGQNNTPNLQDRFVVGAGSTYAVDATGGSANATLVSHSHTINNHTHSFSGSGSSSHSHGIPKGSGGSQASIQNYVPSPRVESVQASFSSDSATVSLTVSGNTGDPSNRGTDSQGSSATNANLPPYYALCYIMKS